MADLPAGYVDWNIGRQILRGCKYGLNFCSKEIKKGIIYIEKTKIDQKFQLFNNESILILLKKII